MCQSSNWKPSHELPYLKCFVLDTLCSKTRHLRRLVQDLIRSFEWLEIQGLRRGISLKKFTLFFMKLQMWWFLKGFGYNVSILRLEAKSRIAISHEILAGFSPAVNQLFRGGTKGLWGSSTAVLWEFGKIGIRGIPHAKFLARGA